MNMYRYIFQIANANTELFHVLWTSSYALAGTAASKKWETSTDDEGGAGTGSRGETHQATSLSSSYPGIRLVLMMRGELVVEERLTRLLVLAPAIQVLD